LFELPVSFGFAIANSSSRFVKWKYRTGVVIPEISSVFCWVSIEGSL
jgi:hypothetical protein